MKKKFISTTVIAILIALGMFSSLFFNLFSFVRASALTRMSFSSGNISPYWFTDTCSFEDDLASSYTFMATQALESDAVIDDNTVLDRYGNYTNDGGATWIMPVPKTQTSSVVNQTAIQAGTLDIDVEKSTNGWRIVNKGNLMCKVKGTVQINGESVAYKLLFKDYRTELNKGMGLGMFVGANSTLSTSEENTFSGFSSSLDKSNLLYVAQTGTLNIDGGLFLNNNLTHTIFADGTLNFSDGRIFENQGSEVKNIIYLSSTGKFYMTGGKIINNFFTSTGNSMVLIDGGVFNMSGGTISENTSDANGVGVCVSNCGTFTMTGGEIINNSGNGYGAVQVANGAQMVMDDGDILQNSSLCGGVFVYNDDSTTEQTVFIMNGGSIRYNTGSNAGAVLIQGNCKFVLNGGYIGDNTGTNAIVATDTNSVVYLNGGIVRGGGIELNGITYISSAFLEDSLNLGNTYSLGLNGTIEIMEVATLPYALNISVDSGRTGKVITLPSTMDTSKINITGYDTDSYYVAQETDENGNIILSIESNSTFLSNLKSEQNNETCNYTTSSNDKVAFDGGAPCMKIDNASFTLQTMQKKKYLLEIEECDEIA